MITAQDPSPFGRSQFGLSQFYEYSQRPVQLTPRTMATILLVVGLHGLAGYLIAHSYFAADPPATADNHVVLIDTSIWKKQPPPPTPATDKTAKPQPQTTGIHDTATTPETRTETLDAVIEPDRVVATGPAETLIATAPQPPFVPPAVRSSVISNPTWISKPTADQVSNYYPARPANLA